MVLCPRSELGELGRKANGDSTNVIAICAKDGVEGSPRRGALALTIWSSNSNA